MWKSILLCGSLFAGAALGLALGARFLEPAALPAAAAIGLCLIGVVLILAAPTADAQAIEDAQLLTTPATTTTPDIDPIELPSSGVCKFAVSRQLRSRQRERYDTGGVFEQCRIANVKPIGRGLVCDGSSRPFAAKRAFRRQTWYSCSMKVEDSYEGAVRRLRRLGHAGVEPAAPPAAQSTKTNDRLRDLEELATLACDQNERLTRDLDGARDEIARLQGVVAALKESAASAQSEAPLAAQNRRGRGLVFYLVTHAIVGGVVAVLFVLRSGERPPAAPAAAVLTAPAMPPRAPVVPVPPPSIPKIEPTVAKAAQPTVPKVQPVAAAQTVVPTVHPREPAPAKTKSQSRHTAKHHAAKSTRRGESKHGSAARSTKKSGVPETDDPLGGLNL